eukprot:TRINITY_DN1714_c0_g1_i1.p2 TRINITY_DN1714_c0_g1~~TRINITY_DN1714_c0_g1_i1.p2  ORF type:complete len:64 (-),score=0.99 TRINITY_DN1714_c0_g1_i1:116-307(-)
MYRRDPQHRLPWVLRQLRTKHAPGKQYCGAELRSAHGWLAICTRAASFGCGAVRRVHTYIRNI